MSDTIYTGQIIFPGFKSLTLPYSGNIVPPPRTSDTLSSGIIHVEPGCNAGCTLRNCKRYYALLYSPTECAVARRCPGNRPRSQQARLAAYRTSGMAVKGRTVLVRTASLSLLRLVSKSCRCRSSVGMFQGFTYYPTNSSAFVGLFFLQSTNSRQSEQTK